MCCDLTPRASNIERKKNNLVTQDRGNTIPENSKNAEIRPVERSLKARKI